MEKQQAQSTSNIGNKSSNNTEEHDEKSNVVKKDENKKVNDEITSEKMKIEESKKENKKDSHGRDSPFSRKKQDSSNSEKSKEKISEKEIKEMQQELETLKKKSDELENKYLKSLAELDNFRKWAEKDKSIRIHNVRASMLMDILTVRDNVERASSTLKNAGIDEKIMSGINMIINQFDKFLEAEKVKPFARPGDRFDHNLHEALYTSEGNVSFDTIKEVYLRGYMLDDKVLRHAKVMVTTPVKTVTAAEDNECKTDDDK